MQRFFKATAFLFSLMLIFNLMGCGSSIDSSIGKQENKADMTHAAASQEKSAKTDPKIEQDQSKETTTSSTDVKSQAPSQAQSTNAQNTKKAVANPSNSPTNAKSSASSSPAATATATKPAATTSNHTAATAPPKTSTTTVSPKPAATVTLSIVGPKGTIMAASKVTITNGETILDVLMQATKKQNIQVDYRGSGATAYVEGIDNIYEFDYGAKSGWTVKQNGSTIPKSAGVITVKSGDLIQWMYTQ